MFQKLKRFLQGDPPPVAGKLDHPVLGTLSWSREEEAWVSAPGYSGVGFAIQIAGTPEPNACLCSHAAELIEKQTEFTRSVQRFLSSQATSVQKFSSFKDEIAGLKIARVCLSWPDRPHDGMLFFEGGSENRLWRCDYIAGSPKNLGFDS